MSNYYKQPVTIFGIVIPCLFMVLLAVIALYMSSSTSAEYRKKKKGYDKAQLAIKQTMGLQEQVQKTKVYTKEWDYLLNTETRGTFLQHWQAAEEKFSGKELTKTSHNWINYSDGIGKGIDQPASQVNMSFSATYRAMQLALLEMETKLPNMQLDSLTITPDANSDSINFETTFTVWTGN